MSSVWRAFLRMEKADRKATFMRDISDRKRVEEALPESEEHFRLEERFRLLVESVKDYAIFMLDPSGRVVTWNVGAERLKGYQAEEIIGEHFSRFYPPEDVARGKPDQELKTAEAEGRLEDEGWLVRKDGSRFWANLVITALRDSAGNLRGFGKVTRDITERKQAEEALQQQAAELARSNDELAAINKELQAFTYSVSHDLRAPLRHVDGFSKILLEEFGPQLNSDAQHCLQRIQEGVRQMGRLVDDLLNLGRVGRQDLNRQPTAMKSLVLEVLAELKPETEGREIEWQIGDLPVVQCDPGLMKLVFANLLSNAIKFTRVQKQTVIEVGQMTGEGQPVIFVRDNGIGFNMRYAHKLFGIFQRLHRAEDFEGTGVGLANVQRIIHKHGGRVWADAEPYKGATFYFTLAGVEATGTETDAVVRGAAWRTAR